MFFIYIFHLLLSLDLVILTVAKMPKWQMDGIQPRFVLLSALDDWGHLSEYTHTHK